MNNQTAINDSPETLKGCLWALSTGTVLVVFVMFCWLGIQRAELAAETEHRKMAESDLASAQMQLNQTIQSDNERVAQEQSARVAAENQAQTALQAKAQAEAEYAQAKAQCDQDARVVTYLRSALARTR
jgi:uncharacterized membrane protein YqiK